MLPHLCFKRSQMTRKCVKNKELVHEVLHNDNDK